jgi:transaldolase
MQVSRILRNATAAIVAGLLIGVPFDTGRRALARYRAGDRWEALAAKGAQTQRVLWASTGTKNPHYSDVLYVEELIGPETVNTVPPETLSAFRDHGRPRASLAQAPANPHRPAH